MKLLICIIGLANPLTLMADTIYQYTNKDGTLVFTNKPTKNSSKVQLPPLNIYASPISKADLNAHSYTATQRALLAINASTQNTNRGMASTGRQQILQEELQKEKLAWDDARAALATAKQVPLPSEKDHPQLTDARLKALQDATLEHQKNIDILSQQLGLNN